MIVLDTHIWVWWVDGNERLTKKHQEYINEYQSQGLGVSILRRQIFIFFGYNKR